MSDTDKSVIIEKGKVREHMYCKKCGKEIEKDSFCKYCGQPAHEGIVKDNGISISESLHSVGSCVVSVNTDSTLILDNSISSLSRSVKGRTVTG